LSAVKSETSAPLPVQDIEARPQHAEKSELTLVKKPDQRESVMPQPRRADDALNWSQLAHELDLDGLARQLVINCVVKSWQQDHLQLAYLPELELMAKPEIKGQIKQAVESRLGLELKLDFFSVPELDAETPQQAYLRKQEEQRLATIERIKEDPVVQKLNKVFGAVLIENSVKKVKE
jgi:hypothetical protein